MGDGVSIGEGLTRLFLVYGTIIGFAIVAIVVIRARQNDKKDNDQRERRERLKAARQAQRAQQQTQSQVTKPQSILDDVSPPPIDDDFDALALLQQARAEAAIDEPEISLSDLFAAEELQQAPVSDTPTGDEDEIDLADLLAGLGEEKKLYRTVDLDTVHRVKLNTGKEIQAKEVISIMQDKSGKLVVLMGDTAYRTFDDNPTEKKRFKNVMKALASVIASETKAKAPKPTPKPKAPEPVEEDKSPELDEASILVQAAKELEEGDAPLPGDLPNYSLDAQPASHEKGRFGRIKVYKPRDVDTVNIADAIESYLQFKIADTPEFQKRGIHVRSNLKGGVRIEADGKSYESVGEVDNEAVRKFLQDTIAEWQERNNRR